MKVGFIGVCNMGGPMCRNIIENTNHEVVVFDLQGKMGAAVRGLDKPVLGGAIADASQ